MENFGYIHLAVEHEDPSPEPTIRSLEELGLTLPTSARVGVAGFFGCCLNHGNGSRCHSPDPSG
ncbi:MAG: hypothetical protein HC936_12775 [Leptolyngbyaceae cyanobacterium SU_3_3]|nr:hypothetical protein [Leptolyngbyaceae cyanobacterium SU_3_3]